MQRKKRTSKPVPPPAKICSFLFGRSGFGLIGIMVAIVATGLLVVPLTRWYISMTNGAEGLQDKLAMQAIIQDHWLTLNDEGFDELSVAIATKGTTWTENVGEGGRYTITTSFGDAGKYVNAACTDGAPGTDERQCRKVSVQIKDNVTGQTQALNLTKVASQTDKRLKDLEAKAVALDGRITTAQNTANTANTNANSALSKFSSYYTAAQVNSKLGNYYTKSETDAKIKESSGVNGANACSVVINIQHGGWGGGTRTKSYTAPSDGFAIMSTASGCYGGDSETSCSSYDGSVSINGHVWVTNGRVTVPVLKGNVIRADIYESSALVYFCPSK